MGCGFEIVNQFYDEKLLKLLIWILYIEGRLWINYNNSLSFYNGLRMDDSS